MIFLRLFVEFFKTGLFAVGGGAATIPFLHDISQRTGWFTAAQLADMIAVSESTPGAIGVNMASYVGFTTAGPLGCVVATLGLILPSILVILVVARFLQQFQSSRTVQDVFYGLRPASAGLIAAACVELARVSLLSLERLGVTDNLLELFRWKELALAAVLLFLVQRFQKHPIVYIAGAAAAGMLFRLAG